MKLMLFNCFHCGRTISSKKEICVYCKTNTSQFAEAFKKTQTAKSYAGTFAAFLTKSRTHI